MPIDVNRPSSPRSTFFPRGLALGPMVLLAVVSITACDTPVVELGAPPARVTSEQKGSGQQARTGHLVTIDYTIQLPDGTTVLRDNGYRFELGRGTVIEGIDTTVEGMRVGGVRVVECPPHRHWGRKGYGDGLIPENTTLTITVRLTRINRADR